MASNLEILLEAEKRGLDIPPEKKALLTEARARGLLTQSGVHGGGLPAPTGSDDATQEPRVRGAGLFSVPADMANAPTGEAGSGEDFVQGLGAGTRAAATGLAHGADILYGPAAATLNAPIWAANELGANIPYLKTLGQKAEEASDRAGLPKANPIEGAAIEGAASVIPTMGAGIIMKGAKAAPAAVRAAGDFLSAAPDVQAVSAAGGAVAGEAAKEHGAGPGGQFLASVAGGGLVGAPYVVAREALPAGWRLIQQLTEDLLSPKAAEKRAGEAMLRNSSSPQTLPARLQEAVDNGHSTPGANPTTGQAVADPGLLAAQNALQSTDPRFAGNLAARNAANNAAWQGTIDGMAPQGAGADAVQGAVRSAFQNFQGATNDMIARATQRAQASIAEVGDHITPERAGQIIRQAVTEEYNAARGRTRTAYDAVDPTGQSAVPTAGLYVPAARAVNERYNNSTFGTPADLNRILTRLRDTSSASLGQIDGIRRDLGDIAGDLNRSASDRSIARQLVGHIDDYLGDIAQNGAPGSNLTAEQTAAMRAARTARTEQGATFERGAVGNVTRTKAYGEPAVPDSGVAAEFLFKGSGSPEAVQQFVQAVGNRPAAVQALQSYAATQLREYATNADGTINPQRLARWAQDHRPILDQFPELNNRVGSAMRAQGLLDNLTGRQERTIDAVQRSALGYFLGDMNPDAAVSRILNSTSSHADMGRLLGVIGDDPDAMNGLRRAIVDHLLSKSTNAGTDITGANVMSQAKFGANLDRYGHLLGQVFSPEHIQAMRQIQADLDRQQLSTAAKALGSNTVQNLSAASLLSNVSKGLVPLDNPIAQNLMRPYSWLLKLPEERIRQILSDAMLDPELALRLVQQVKPVSSPSLSLALRQRAAALGIGVSDGSEQRQIASPAGAAQIGAATSTSEGYAQGGLVQQPKGYAKGGLVTNDRAGLRSIMKDKRPLKEILAERRQKQHAAKFPNGTGKRTDPVKAETHHDTALAGARIKQNASPAEKEAGNYSKGHVTWNGLSITLETPKGGTRTAKDGSWEVRDFPSHYGYVKRSTGADAEQVDVFLGDHLNSKRVWVIDQRTPETGKFDEHKVMLGYATPKAARDAYVSAFTNGSGESRIGGLTMMSVDQFKSWLHSGKTKKPIAMKAPASAVQPRSPASGVAPAMSRGQEAHRAVA
jgi:hypothetical protein